MSNIFFDDGRPIGEADVLLDTAISMIGMNDTLYAVLDELSDEQKEDVLSRVIEKAEMDMEMTD